MRDIYVLVDESRTIRYVGSSKDTAKRLKSHWRSRGKAKGLVSQWLATLSAPPDLVIMQSVEDDVAGPAERYWIELLRQVPSVDLLNQRVSSSGSATWTAERRERASKAQMGKGKGRKLSPQTRERMRQAHLGKKFPDEHRAKLREVNLGRKHTPETLQKMSDSHKGLTWSDAQREKSSESLKRRWAEKSPEQRREIALKIWETRRRNASGEAA